jgi:hypothetical protein
MHGNEIDITHPGGRHAEHVVTGINEFAKGSIAAVVTALERNNVEESRGGPTGRLVDPNQYKLETEKDFEAMRGNAQRMYSYCVAADAGLTHRISIETTRLVSDVRDPPRQDGVLEDLPPREGQRYVLLGCGSGASAVSCVLKITRVLSIVQHGVDGGGGICDGTSRGRFASAGRCVRGGWTRRLPDMDLTCQRPAFVDAR